jgi:putative membrane protein insertion efficiency factor
MKQLLIVIIRCYQKVIAPAFPPHCRFHPSCSTYAIMALKEKGVLRGMLCVFWRLARCNPFSSGGYDPVN